MQKSNFALTVNDHTLSGDRIISRNLSLRTCSQDWTQSICYFLFRMVSERSAGGLKVEISQRPTVLLRQAVAVADYDAMEEYSR